MRNLATWWDLATRGWDWLRLVCCPVVREGGWEALDGWERVWSTRDRVTLGLVSESACGLVVEIGSGVSGAAAVSGGGSGQLSGAGVPASIASGAGTAGGVAAGAGALAETGGLGLGGSARCSGWPRL